MTGAIILYDHVSETGVFTKKSPVNVRTTFLHNAKCTTD